MCPAAAASGAAAAAAASATAAAATAATPTPLLAPSGPVQDIEMDFERDLAFPLYSYIGAGAFGQVHGSKAEAACCAAELGPLMKAACQQRYCAGGCGLWACTSSGIMAGSGATLELHPAAACTTRRRQVHRAILRGTLPVAVKVLTGSGSGSGEQAGSGGRQGAVRVPWLLVQQPHCAAESCRLTTLLRCRCHPAALTQQP